MESAPTGFRFFYLYADLGFIFVCDLNIGYLKGIDYYGTEIGIFSGWSMSL